MKTNYPLSHFYFQVEWGGARIGFLQVKGLNLYIDLNDSEKEIQEDIILSRNVFNDDFEFYRWIKSRKNGIIERRDIVISLLNERHETVIRWKVAQAFPVKYLGPVLDAEVDGIAKETLVLHHKGWQIDLPSDKSESIRNLKETSPTVISSNIKEELNTSFFKKLKK